MRFELVKNQRSCELSRKAFARMLSEALELSENYTTWNSVDCYTGEDKKYWFFLDLGIKFDVYYDSLEEMEELMKELGK